MLAPSRAPSLPSTAASDCGEFCTIIIVISLFSETSLGQQALKAPWLTTLSKFASTMSYAETSYPASIMFLAIGAPIIPRPTKPIFSPIIFSP